jgi:hypothetical protein
MKKSKRETKQITPKGLPFIRTFITASLVREKTIQVQQRKIMMSGNQLSAISAFHRCGEVDGVII